MNPQLNKLRAAIGPVAAAIDGRIAENVAKCPEMSYPDKQKYQTNPPNQVAHQRGLSPRQRAAVQMLVAGCTACAVARQLAINPRTVFRWKHDSRFIQAIEKALAGQTSHLARASLPLHARPVRSGSRDREEPYTEEERREAEKIMALCGLTPSWKRKSGAQGREMSGNVAKCHTPGGKMPNEPTADGRAKTGVG